MPFVWLRHDPSSWAGAVATAYPGQDPSFQVVTAAEQTAYFDGYQWWWHVRVYPDGGAEGWVEQASLEVSNFDPDDDGDVVPPAKANWRVPTNGRVTEGVPFL